MYLTRLEHAGIVIRRHGIGTYVNRLVTSHPGTVQYWLDETASFANLIRGSGHRAECHILASTTRAGWVVCRSPRRQFAGTSSLRREGFLL